MPVVLSGFDELFDWMDGVGSRVERKKILATAMRKAEAPILAGMIARAPDDPLTAGNRITKYARKAVLDQSSYGVLGKVGDTAKGFVGYFHEYGTDHLGARPFLGPAWEDSEDEFLSILGDQLMLGIIGQLVEEELDSE